MMYTVNDIVVKSHTGPWKTKSNADLSVLFMQNINFVKSYFNIDKSNPNNIENLTGLRIYIVDDIPLNSVGAHEWHNARNEIAIVLKGRIEWKFQDKHGNKLTKILGKNMSVYIPNNILHTYKSLSHNSSLLVIANTIFDPDDSSTHDTYPANSFIIGE